MDLSTIEMKLLERKYKKKIDFVKDMDLMLVNCLNYNGLYSGELCLIVLNFHE